MDAIKLTSSPRVEVFEGFATPEECAHLRQLALAQEEFSIQSLQYAGMASYHSAHIDLALRKSDPVLSALETRVAQATGLTALHAADDVMIARTQPWDPKDNNTAEKLKAMLSGAQEGEGRGRGGEAEVGTVRVVDSDDSCDSEGFRIRPMADASAADVQARALMNIHHDHNNNTARSCTFMVYLSDVPEEGGGETFYPIADAPAADHVRVAFESLYSAGRFIVQHPDPGEELPEEEMEALYECEARYHMVKCVEADSGRPRLPPGVFLGDDESPGVLVTPREGRAVLFFHEEEESGTPARGTAWHAPCTVREGDKWLLTLFKVPAGRPSAAPGPPA